MTTDTPLELATRYRKTVASRYRALKPDELDALPPGTLQLSPKIDGELWFAVLEGTTTRLIAPNGRTLESAPVVDELHVAAKRTRGRTVLAGELFAAGGKPRPRVGDVGSALAAGGDALEKLGWQGFDVVEVDGAPPPADLEARGEVLSRLLEGGKRATAIKTVTTADRSEVAAQWQAWGASGKAEGMVVRVGDGRIFKVKPGFNLDAVVVGFTARAEAPDQARSLVFAVLRADGTFQLVGSVGNLGTEDTRRSLLAMLAPLECPSGFRHTSGDGTLTRWVRPEVVIEVQSTDVQSEDSDGNPVQKWAVRYEPAGWKAFAAMPGASVLHPVLVRVRSDKAANPVDVRASQLTERCDVASLEARAEQVALPSSEIVRREVWTKVTKGKTAVRKLLVWRTQKEKVMPGWPAWVIHFTDYSPDRKTPLERTVRTATSQEDARVIADGLVTENIKKGWEPVLPGSLANRASNSTGVTEASQNRVEQAVEGPRDGGLESKAEKPRSRAQKKVQ